MKKIFALLFLLSGYTAIAQPVDSLRYLVDSTLSIMERFALNRNKINWKEISKTFYEETKGISNKDSLLKRFPSLFRSINDYHGGMQVRNKFISWEEGRSIRIANKMLDSAFRKGPHLVAERWNNIGYFRVPGGTTKNVAYVTQMLADSLCKLKPGTIEGWIIDLRLNSGGNVWFMITSLAWLIGDGEAGGIRYTDGRSDATTRIKDGKVYGNNQVYEIPDKNCSFPTSNVPVVVLTGPKTASSAEGLALAFKGRKNTLIIGEPTAGLVTSNNSFPLDSDVTLVLATGYMLDRAGNAYTASIVPDIEVVGGDNFYILDQDKKVKRALKWLKSRQK